MACVIKKRPDVDESDENLDYLERYKVRLINDHLRSGVNDACKTAPKCTFGNLELGAQKVTEGCWLFVIDFSDCFMHFPIGKKSEVLLGFWDPIEQKFGRYKYLCFGLQCAPYVNDYYLKLALKQLLIEEEIDLADFVDDNLGSGRSHSEAWSRFERAVLFFLSLCLKPTTKKSGLKPPKQQQSWIGWLYDAMKTLVKITDEKCLEAIRRIDRDLAEPELHVKQFMGTTGLLCHIGEVHLSGKRRLHSCWTCINKTEVSQMWRKGKKQYNPRMTLDSAARRDLVWWKRELERGNIWKKIIPNDDKSSTMWTARCPDFEKLEVAAVGPDVHVLEIDAAKTHHWGVIDCQNNTAYQGLWPEHLKMKAKSKNQKNKGLANNINYKEMYVAAVECVNIFAEKYGEMLHGKKILLRCDNLCAISYINFRYGDKPAFESLADKIDKFESTYKCSILATHIKGKENVVADMLSRQQHAAEQWNSDRYMNAQLSKKAFESEIHNSIWNEVFVDCFADSSGKNSHCKKYFSCKNSAFIQAYSKSEPVYAFPPRCLIRQWLTAVTEKQIPSVNNKISSLQILHISSEIS